MGLRNTLMALGLCLPITHRTLAVTASAAELTSKMSAAIRVAGPRVLPAGLLASPGAGVHPGGACSGQ